MLTSHLVATVSLGQPRSASIDVLVLPSPLQACPTAPTTTVTFIPPSKRLVLHYVRRKAQVRPSAPLWSLCIGYSIILTVVIADDV